MGRGGRGAVAAVAPQAHAPGALPGGQAVCGGEISGPNELYDVRAAFGQAGRNRTSIRDSQCPQRKTQHPQPPIARWLAVNVDGRQGMLAEKIGSEWYMEWAVEDAAQWQPLLHRLTRQGLCLEDKRYAVENFPGRTNYTLCEQLSGKLDGIVHPFVIRNVHHVKLNYLGARFAAAKAYLGVYRPGAIGRASCRERVCQYV